MYVNGPEIPSRLTLTYCAVESFQSMHLAMVGCYFYTSSSSASSSLNCDQVSVYNIPLERYLKGLEVDSSIYEV